ncbi:hypothetical protein BH11ARM1_BH11ARM1_10860 [soil metagenome]
MSSRGTDLADTFQEFLGGCAKFLLGAGGLAMLIGLGFVIFTATSADKTQTAAALHNVEIFKTMLSIGALAVAVGGSFLFWGEEIFVGVQLMGAALMYFFPLYFPMIVGQPPNPQVYGACAAAIQEGGTIYGLVAIIVTIADIIVRTRDRMKNGAKADQLKYGRGVKEEKDRQNIILGKCWQLPYCRKFVRERCPIFHAKTTCWKELVGCMCEEAVIRNAMENRPIPKDALLAGNMIPRNNKLTVAQKRERCRSCVIYNEHQRHKYKVYMPALVGGFVVAYVLLRIPLLAATSELLGQINGVVKAGSLGHAAEFAPPQAFVEMLLAVFFIIGLTYSMKTLEFMIFKAKI